MGIDIYHLVPGARRQILIDGAAHDVGTISRLWKVTETDLMPGREETLDALADMEAVGNVATPPVVMVDGVCEFGEILAYRLLAWDAGRLKTQDYDWDHLPTVAWAAETRDGLVVHEHVGGHLVAMSGERAKELGIVGPDGRLAQHRLPVIKECRSVERMVGGSYAARCVFQDGREAEVFGESESGDLPDAAWFAGRSTAAAGRYRLAEQVAWRSGTAGDGRINSE
jgi:hypothetical protein